MITQSYHRSVRQIHSNTFLTTISSCRKENVIRMSNSNIKKPDPKPENGKDYIQRDRKKKVKIKGSHSGRSEFH